MQIKNCEVCGKEFETKQPYSKYCSRDCYLEVHKKKLVTLECEQCGNKFDTFIKGQRFCGYECYGISQRGKNKSHRKFTDTERRKRLIARSLKWQKENKTKVYVQNIAHKNQAILTILYECICDHPKKQNHHPDYSRPLEVIKLCPACHAAWHKKLRSLTAQAVAI